MTAAGRDQSGDGAAVAVIGAALPPHAPPLSAADTTLLTAAYTLAADAHHGQFRSSGEPYVIHPHAVAVLAAGLGLDVATIAAGLCHDVAEDTDVTVPAISAALGADVAFLVDGVTKLDAVVGAAKAERVAGSLNKLLLAATADPRVLALKLCDRSHNMSTLHHLSPARQHKIATETLAVYAPIAHRLGLGTMKAELEDAAFAILEPSVYAAVSAQMGASSVGTAQRLADAVALTRGALEAAGIVATVTWRAKSVYSTYRKTTQMGVRVADLADLLGIRVVVDSVPDCYAALGVMHAAFTPVVSRFRDYIALPKFGHYRALHTTVMVGGPLEVQIRTWEMHAEAEFGSAAHWRYKAAPRGVPSGPVAARPVPVPVPVPDLPWLHDLVASGARAGGPEEFMDALRGDLQVGEIVAFTPLGDPVALPGGATVLDFAYHVHSEVGHHAVAAHVNGVLSPLGASLHAGDRVEVVTGKTAMPRAEWLAVVTTSRAKHHIRAGLALEVRTERIAVGRAVLTRACTAAGVDPGWDLHLTQQQVSGALGGRHVSDVLAGLAEVPDTAGAVVTSLVASLGLTPAPPGGAAPLEPSPQAPPVPAGRASGRTQSFTLEATARQFAMAEILTTLASVGATVTSASVEPSSPVTFTMRLAVGVADAAHGAAALAQLRGLDDVLKVSTGG